MGLFYSLLGSGFLYYFIIFQVLCAVHCVRTGRNMYWLWIILMFSGVGCLVYFIAEVLPGMRLAHTLSRFGDKVMGVFDPDRELRRKSADFAISNNIESTCNYAEQLVRKGKHTEAVELYSNARKGVFLHDPLLMVGLAKAYFAAGKFSECATTIEELKQHSPEQKSQDTRLLHVMALEADGRIQEALNEYKDLVDAYPGPEAKCRYAQLLKKHGEPEKALALFNEIKLYAINAPKYYRRQHKSWIAMAVNECKLATQKAG